MAKKITIEKADGVAEVIDRILEEPDNKIVVVIPKGSTLGKSPRNFHLLRREAESAGKFLTIESVDDAILALAKDAGLEAAHSFWKNQGTGGEMSDIIPAGQKRNQIEAEDEDEEESPAQKISLRSERKHNSSSVEKITPTEASVVEEDEESETEATTTPTQNIVARGERFFKERTSFEIEDDESKKEKNRAIGKGVGITAAILILVAAALYGVTALFGHASVMINFKKTPWQYSGTITATVSAAQAYAVNTANNTVTMRAQIFKTSKNVTQLFPASSEQNVSVKAQGILTIYNAYSSAAQTLVATTRFVTPAGQIFRLINQITVPGAAITNGQIVPSSINAPVIADAAGPSYNIGPVAKLTVPGFANTPKFDGFYGTFASSTSGGFTGQKAVPTASDIASAKASTTAILESSLQSGLSASYPNNFKILPDATSIQITQLTANTTTDQNGNFSVFGKATLQTIGFDETALKTALLLVAQNTEPSSTFNSITISYGNSTPDFANGILGVPVNVQASLEPTFSVSDFQTTLAGQDIGTARSTVAAIPDLDEGSISVWPAWLWKMPTNTDKITVSVN